MNNAKTIAVGGFQHETNTFAPHRADYEAFERVDGWPALTRGEALFEVMTGLNIPLSGYLERAQAAGHELLPLCWCSAEPSGYVTRDAFERIAAIICDGIASAGRLDGVYLDLHGAMVCEHHEDGEGELLRRVRDIVGPAVPIVISLDLHVNLTRAMLDHSDAMTIYRTYPHLDMADTGARAFDLLEALIAGPRYHKVLRKIPFLLPLTSQCTDFEPCRSIYRLAAELSRADGVANVEFGAGFPPSDIAECGPGIVAYGTDHDATEAAADEIYRRIVEAEAEFEFELLDTDIAVDRAMQNSGDKPVVIADAQDNPGAGGTADTTGLLTALLHQGAQRAVLAMLYDPEAVRRAHQLGVGAEFDAGLGANSGFAGIEPLLCRLRVEALGDGDFMFTGEMQLNSHAQLGPMALLRVQDAAADLRVIVGSSRFQCLDQAILRHVGVEPAEQGIIVVKSTVHFRADFDSIAAETLVAIAPGANYCRMQDLKFKNLRDGVRLGPLGPEYAP